MLQMLFFPQIIRRSVDHNSPCNITLNDDEILRRRSNADHAEEFSTMHTIYRP
jgi:hypothetical protein